LKKQYNFSNVIRTPFNTELGPLLTLEADVAVVLEPNATYAIKNGAKELSDFSEIEAVTTGFCVTKSFYSKNKKEIYNLSEMIKKGIEIFENDNALTLNVAKKYFPLVNENILNESIERIRKADIYCRELKFSDKEIEEGLRLRDIDMSVKDVKKFIV